MKQIPKHYPEKELLFTPLQNSSDVNNNTLRHAHKTQRQRFGSTILLFSVTSASIHSQKTRRVINLGTVTRRNQKATAKMEKSKAKKIVTEKYLKTQEQEILLQKAYDILL
jgi:hypothetical protein